MYISKEQISEFLHICIFSATNIDQWQGW